ncbi:MAG: hypothetical protein SV062_06250 [Thermodesulfobacteriota bacterium]|nr:hypothetical protein [Thermodesulfobacteriota bacterium]
MPEIEENLRFQIKQRAPDDWKRWEKERKLPFITISREYMAVWATP